MIGSRIISVCVACALNLPETAFAGVQEPVVSVAPAAPVPAVATPTVAAPAPTSAEVSAPGVAPVISAGVQGSTPAQRAIASAPTPVPPPRIAPAPPPPPTDDKDTTGMIVAGASMAGAFYFFTSLAGAVVIDKTRRPSTLDELGKRTIDTRRLNYGRSLLVPVAGPFIAMHYTRSATERWGLALTGVAQSVGIVLALVGATRRARARRAERIGVSPGFAAGGATMGVQGRF